MLDITFRRFQVILFAAIAVFMLCGIAVAQPKVEVLDRWKAEDARIARLAGLARVWGAVKFFHPYLAYQDVDWDKALIETIPRVNAAKSPEEYNAAINHLLSFLNDKNTGAEIVKESKAAPTSTEKIDKEKLMRVVDGVLIIEVTMISEALAQDNTAFNQFRERIHTLLPQAKAIVLNCRAKGEMGESATFYFDLFAKRVLALILDSTVTLASSRYRMHNGYSPQTGTTS